MIKSTLMPSNDFKTLAERMSEGRLPVADALRYAMQLADSLRRLHDSGKAHGAVTPLNVSVTAAGLDLLPAPEWSLGAITPYTAPEVLQGREPDSRSDIFSFGAIVFEMLTGRRAFEGETRATLMAHITHSPTPASGNPAVDRLVGTCLAKNPEARSSRMQKVTMELKLLSVAARRVDPALAGSGLRREPLDSGALRTEMQQLEGRINARFQSHERAVIDLQRSADETMSSLKVQVASMGAELAAAKLRGGAPSGAGMDGSVASDRLIALERKVEDIRQHVAQFERCLAADLVDIENGLKGQSEAIESSRTAMSQTDDLVERVVEALESLQSAVLDQADAGGERPSFAVN